jgi:hypothetical protein
VFEFEFEFEFEGGQRGEEASGSRVALCVLRVALCGSRVAHV